ncbi:VCBS repeat-containing protein [Streptomyces sp. NPDC006265]|uniref:FG-GAP repeat domain-containing protein n=1 Tax=Streptomyces sp. NPDC006265 TaxID=3156740 RepID=UPI0033AC8F4F
MQQHERPFGRRPVPAHPSRRRRARLALATGAAAALTGTLLSATAGTATAADGTHAARADFNGDGIGDVAFSASGAFVSGKKDAGQLVVLYGTKTGVSSAKRSAISQNTTGNPGTAEAGDVFGADSAYADFNGDGYDDLAVSSPMEDVGSDKDGGTVAVLWGSAQGITGKGDSIADAAPTKHDRWGRNLAAGDFDGDGKADLAVGNTSNTLYVLKGGISGSGTAIKGRYGVKAPVQASGDGSGPLNITAGDVNGDHRTDLVADGFETATGHYWNTNYLLPGTSSGLSAAGAQPLKSGVITGIGDVNGDGFQDLVNGDGFQDLVNGVAGEDIGSVTDAGQLVVLYGSASGINTSSGTQSFAQSTAGVPGSDEKDDFLGADVKLEDVTGDGRADVLAGSYENDGNGAVLYLPSNGTKITATGSRTVSPSDSGVSTTGYPNFGANFAD